MTSHDDHTPPQSSAEDTPVGGSAPEQSAAEDPTLPDELKDHVGGPTSVEFQYQQLKKEYESLENRYNSVMVILVGLIVVIIAFFFDRFIDEFWVPVFTIISSFLLIFGIYNYLLADAE